MNYQWFSQDHDDDILFLKYDIVYLLSIRLIDRIFNNVLDGIEHKCSMDECV